ncbi:MAG: phosphate propanoyltransferase [Oscillospiraceae bacterium]
MKNQVPVETSARHLHVTKEHLAILFGPDAKLTNKKDLSQPGQFACFERVDIVGPKSTFKGVSILGPVRAATQIEISSTDARTLGLSAPIRESGDIVGTPGCKLVGPVGTVELSEGVIVAKRHVHFSPADGVAFGVSDKEVVQVRIESAQRTLIFDDVVCRVHPTYALAMHIDVDESNAAGCVGDVYATLIKKA